MKVEDFSIDELQFVLKNREIDGDSVLKTNRSFSPFLSMTDPKLQTLGEVSNDVIISELRKREKAIYGTDTRCEIHELTDARIEENAKAVCTIIETRNTTDNGNGTTTLHGIRFQDFANLCDCEKYKNQPVVSTGTAFLVDPSIIITAAHCIDENNINNFQIIFGFEILNGGATRTIIDNKNIYTASKILGWRLEDSTEIDWAVVQLNRPVLDKKPLVCDFTESSNIGDSIYCIGHPTGLPKKIAIDGQINSANKHFYTANIDTYAGNSGSPIFNSQSHKVIGILVRGEPNDFIKVGDCYQSQRCIFNNCTGEDVMKTMDYEHLIPDQKLPGFDFNPDQIEIIDNRYIKLKDGELLDFLGKEDKLQPAYDTIKYYKLNFKGHLTGNTDDFHYYLSDGKAPTGNKAPYKDELPFNRNKIEIRRINGRWKIVSERRWMFDFDQNQENARQALSIILRYQFNYSCHVGRPQPPLHFLKA